MNFYLHTLWRLCCFCKPWRGREARGMDRLREDFLPEKTCGFTFKINKKFSPLKNKFSSWVADPKQDTITPKKIIEYKILKIIIDITKETEGKEWSLKINNRKKYTAYELTRIK